MRFPQEVHEFVKQNMTRLRDDDLAEACNKKFGTHFNKSRMKNFRNNHGYRCGRKKWTTEEEYWRFQRHYPQGVYEYIRDNSKGVSSEKMAAIVNEKFGTKFSKTGMKQFRRKYNIHSGLTGRFNKGQAPANKGKKLVEYLPPEKAEAVLKKVRKTAFKKGNIPGNTLPVGTISINKEGYKLRKKQMEGTMWERWEFLHTAVWEEHYGKVPKGMVVVFKDQDRQNCSIDNLVLMSRPELLTMSRRGLLSDDPDLTMTGLTLTKLRIKRNSMKKREKKS